LEAELRVGSADCAVHSLKDLPVEDPRDLTVGCIPGRGEVRDALISRSGASLSGLPEGALVGTSSLRRSGQLLAVRPDLRTASLRGNVDTRLRKALVGQYDAILLAGAGLLRLDLGVHVTEWLPLDVMLPAPGQGALAIQCRLSDRETLNLLASIEDAPTRHAVTAERAFLSGLGAGCSLPVAAYAAPSKQDASILHLAGLVISPDGRQAIRLNARGQRPEELGGRLALDAISQGALDVLAAGRPV
jgi:hydroxymethylbilane synthase